MRPQINSWLPLLNKSCLPKWLGVLLALLFFGALFWAKGRDPFQRVWFKIKTPDFGKAGCIAVLPKMAARPLPVVVYLHGSGGSLLGSGNELRQMAEMGLAAVGMEYSQTNGAAFEAQFAALLVWLRNQKWADTNKVAWVGFSLGAQKQLSFALKHPGSQPGLLIRVSGGWVDELQAGGRRADVRLSTSDFRFSKVLLLHGEQDSAFPIADARRVAAALATNGFPVELKSFPGQAHNFDPDRGVLFRGIGEYCLRHFNGEEAFASYESILSWQARAKPLWLFWTPALAWMVLWFYIKRPLLPTTGGVGKLSRWEIGLRWLAGIVAALALAQTALHLLPPRLAVSNTTLDIARKHLIQPKEKNDFEVLAVNPVWQGKRLKALLTHVELANYNRELINWKLDDEIYREFVLAPQVAAAFDGEMNWRRPLWEHFYPRVRKENSPEAAAEIIVRHLRERVTIVENFDSPRTIADVWLRQITNEQGFEAIYVAALRSAGVPARLTAQHKAEFWTGSEWKPAPRPLIQSATP